MQELVQYLASCSYPGRGIVVGHNFVYYFIMGRSKNSQNRIFATTPDGIQTLPFDPAAVEDPSLIIYHPVRQVANALIVTNGDQTDTIAEKGFVSGCLAQTFEPDEPNFTPRISCELEADGTVKLSILKRDASTGSCMREFFVYEQIAEGTCRLLTTYEGDGDPLPSFAGEPKLFSAATPEEVWAALDAQNKISLYANVAGEVRLFNKHLGD